MLKKIDKLIFKEFLGPFFLTFAIVLFIFLTQYLISNFKDFIGKDLGVDIFIELFSYFSLVMTPIALPLAALLSSLMTYGNLGEHAEITAIKSSGISLPRILLPTTIFMVFLTAFALLFNDKIVPIANLKAFSLLWDIRQKKTTLELKDGVFYNGLPGYSIKVDRKIKSKENEGVDTLVNLMIYNHTAGNGNTEVILAEKGQMFVFKYHGDDYLTINMLNGATFSEITGRDANNKIETEFFRQTFDTSRIIFDMGSFGMKKTREELFEGHTQMKNVNELYLLRDSILFEMTTMADYHKNNIKNYYYTITSTNDNLTVSDTVMDSLYLALKNEQPNYIDLEAAANRATSIKYISSSNKVALEVKKQYYVSALIDIHKRYAQSFAVFVMFLIGAPLGSIIKKGGLGVPVLISIFFFVIYYVLSLLGKRWAEEYVIPASVGVWGANVILLFFGLFFMRQAYIDARLFDADYYFVIFSKLKKSFNKNAK
jgi:lipopolysaccharide export system permease protein